MSYVIFGLLAIRDLLPFWAAIFRSRRGYSPRAWQTWHDGEVNYRSGTNARPRIHGSQLTRLVTVIALLILAALPAGCASTGPGDRMAGKIVVGQVPSDDPGGPELTAPGELTGLAQVQPYDSNGKIGTQMIFQDITFGQFNQLGEVVSQAFDTSAASMKMRVQRNGGTVILSGTADLASLPPNSALIVVSVQFPGPVTATNGQQESDDLVTWTINSGTSAALTAEAAYADPSIGSFVRWAWITAAIAFLVALLVAAMAYLRRDRNPKPGQESDEPESVVELPQWLREKLNR